MVTLVTDVICTVTKVTRVSVLMITLVPDVTVLLPRLPVSVVAMVTLATDVSCTVTKVTSVSRCYGYVGY
jgi:hypothetical protein